MAGILASYSSALRSNPRTFAGQNFPTEFDFKFDASEQLSNDVYQVGNQWFRGNEFGNYAAGYAGFSVFGGLGWVAVRVVGVRFAMERNQHGERTSGEHWSDLESAPMINAGARRAEYDIISAQGSWGMRGGIIRRGARDPALTSTAGCTK